MLLKFVNVNWWSLLYVIYIAHNVFEMVSQIQRLTRYLTCIDILPN